MFRRNRRVLPKDKPEDERKIEVDAYVALRQSRQQIHRASDILQSEVQRLDKILSKGQP